MLSIYLKKLVCFFLSFCFYTCRCGYDFFNKKKKRISKTKKKNPKKTKPTVSLNLNSISYLRNLIWKRYLIHIISGSSLEVESNINNLNIEAYVERLIVSCLDTCWSLSGYNQHNIIINLNNFKRSHFIVQWMCNILAHLIVNCLSNTHHVEINPW